MKRKHLPFTLVMWVLLIGFGIYGQAHVGRLDPDVHRNNGISTKLLLAGQLHRMLTSLFFTAGGWMFYASVIMFAMSVGWVEWKQGTRRAMLTFFGVHVATLLILSFGIALPLAALDLYRGQLLFAARDVGTSAGYYGCIGVAVGGLSRRAFRIALPTIVVFLIVRLGWSALQLPEQGRMLSADLAHAIAFPLGLFAGLEWDSNRKQSGLTPLRPTSSTSKNRFR